MSRIIITDPHGCYKTLMALMAKLPPGIPVTFAGDLIDRGPRSAEVVDFVMNGGYDCIRGNHEQMMVEEARVLENGDIKVSPFFEGIWIMNGGDKAMISYEEPIRVDPDTGQVLDMPYPTMFNAEKFKEHLQWMKNLPFYIEYRDLKNASGDYLMVSHSSAARVWDLREGNAQQISQFEMSVIWDRNTFPAKIEGIYNVYGHTPQDGGPTIKPHFACIDNGVYFKRPPFGRLFALQFPEMVIFEQEYID